MKIMQTAYILLMLFSIQAIGAMQKKNKKNPLASIKHSAVANQNNLAYISSPCHIPRPIKYLSVTTDNILAAGLVNSPAVCLFDIKQNGMLKRRKKIFEHEGYYDALVYSNHLFASSISNKLNSSRLNIYNLDSGKCIKTLTDKICFTKMAVCHKKIVLGNAKGRILIACEKKSMWLPRCRKSKASIFALEPLDNNQIMYATNDNYYHIVDIEGRNFEYYKFTRPIQAISMQSGKIVTASEDCVTYADNHTKENHIALKKHTGLVNAVKWYKDNFLISAGNDGYVCVWDIRYNKVFRELSNHAPVFDILVHNDRLMYAASGSGLESWNLPVLINGPQMQ